MFFFSYLFYCFLILFPDMLFSSVFMMSLPLDSSVLLAPLSTLLKDTKVLVLGDGDLSYSHGYTDCFWDVFLSWKQNMEPEITLEKKNKLLYIYNYIYIYIYFDLHIGLRLCVQHQYSTFRTLIHLHRFANDSYLLHISPSLRSSWIIPCGLVRNHLSIYFLHLYIHVWNVTSPFF